ncbi:hypothetical protein M2138_000863 [Dysgonomonadaceae bacterium PH5-43]|nr:hypothetical protein [Dysgonomonadaceae bacterium PH5-43]
MKLLSKILVATLCILCNSCLDIEEFKNTPEDNFRALWKVIDENYCFFEYKDIDWDQVYVDYSKQIKPDMSKDSLFYLMDEMLQELKDGHVNIVSAFDLGRYWKWFEDYEDNYYQEIIDKYLGTDYQIAGGFRYKMLNDSIGYIRYADFSSSFSESNLDYIIKKFYHCAGIIIDVRNNGGGYLTNSERIASRFFKEKTLVGYIQHKTGKGHNEFSKPHPMYIEPSNRLSYNKKVIVLTNRRCYSATNDFVNVMKYAPNALIIGDKTGGGSGLPFSSEIPNGWHVRFSACPMYNDQMEHLEFGITPDVFVRITDIDIYKKRDTIIEKAISIIKGDE